MGELLRLGINGAAGRMGRAVAELAATDESARVVFAGEHAEHRAMGEATTGAVIRTTDELASATVDVLIDFSSPAGALRAAEICEARGVGMVVGTTGFTEDEMRRLRQAGERVAVLHAQNMSVGVNALYEIAATAAKLLRAGRLGGGFDIEVVEAHHRHKKDAPSGTALRLGQALARATGADISADGVFAREGRECQRGDYDIGFSAVRGGDIVGEHSVIFAGGGERLEITHRSTSRVHYAAGAIRAAKFIATAAPAFYDGMEAILG